MANLPQIPRRIVTTEFTGSRYRGDASVFSPYKMLAQGVSRLAGDLQAISEDYQRGRAEDAADQGANAVETDEQGNPRVAFRSNMSQSGRAYNRAATAGFLASFETQHATKLREEELKYEGKPEEFAAFARDYIVQAANNAAENDPALQGPATRILERYANQSYQGLISRKHDTDIRNSHDALATRGNALLEDAKRLAKQGGTQTDDFKEIWGSYTDIVSELGENPEFARLGKNKAWATDILDKSNDEVIGATLEGVVEQVKDASNPEAALKIIESVLDESGFSGPKREEKRLEWRAKVLDAAQGRLVLEGKDEGALKIIELAPENFVSGGSAVVDRIVGVESGGDPNARAKTSSAAGLGQFTEGTWIDTITRHRPDLVEGKTRAQVLMMRYDDTTSLEMTARHAEDNTAGLQAAGFEATNGNVYLAHFAGVDAAIKLLRASADTPVSDILSKGAINANKSILKGKTAGEVIAWAGRKIGEGAPVSQLSSRGLTLRTSVQKNITQRDALFSGLRREVSEAYQSAKKGFAPPEESLSDLRARVTGSGSDKLAVSLAAAEQLHAFNRQIQVAPPLALGAWVRDERTRLSKGATQVELDRLEAAESTLTKMRTELDSDPLSWASRAEVVDVAPIDFANPSTLTERKKAAGIVAQHYGVEEKLFTRDERDMLVGQFKTGDPAARLELANVIATGFGDDAPRAMSEIAKDSPAAAHLTRLLSLNPNYLPAARDGFKGLEGAKGNETMTRIADEEIGTAVDSRLGVVRAEITQAANAIYTARAIDQGVTEFDEPLYREAVQDAAGRSGEKGGIGSYNGREVLLPPHLSSDDLADVVRGLTTADLDRLSLNGGAPIYKTRGGIKLVKPEDLADAYLVTSGMGTYNISMSDPASGAPSYVLDGTGIKLYEIDLTRSTP